MLATDPNDLDADQALEEILTLEKIVACAQATQTRRTARFAALRPGTQNHPYGEYAADELACALSITGNAAHARLDLALILTRRLRGTLAALGRGDIDLYKARTLAEVTEPLSDAHAGAVEDRVLARAGGQTASQLRQAARRAVLRIDPQGAQQRHEQRTAERTVEVYPLEDGMAALNATLPATQATAIYHRLDAIARNAAPDDPRGMDARRADVLADLLLATRPGQPNNPLARVHVTVPASTLAGDDDQPGDLAGYGPVPAGMARQAAAEGVWRRLVTDPITGALLDYGRTTYRPPTDLADFTRARDLTCRFPSCRQPATRCDLDHTTPTPTAPPTAPTSAHYADTTTASSTRPTGRSPSSRTACSGGPAPPAAPTPPPPNPPNRHRKPHQTRHKRNRHPSNRTQLPDAPPTGCPHRPRLNQPSAKGTAGGRQRQRRLAARL
jgi:hypothetical protein